MIARADGYRESSESWASLLRDCQRRGTRAPVLTVGDGALGFWHALNEIFPETRHLRPKMLGSQNGQLTAQPAAKRANQDIYNAEDKEHAAAAVKAFAKQYGAEFGRQEDRR
uniref:transposase n=1 Tax=Streptomyces longispororuber TaxID=68230 RepID=UPI00210BAEBA|nr:transposase [Streptomyces longispororuber]